jgi:hypothetical protein
MTSSRNQFHFTETLYLCLRSLRGDCIVAADSWANSPKGGDAKPPVYGTYVPMTAGLPVRTLTHSDCAGHAQLLGSDAPTDPSRAAPGARLPSAKVLRPHAGHLDRAKLHSLWFGNASCAARDALGSPDSRRRGLQTSTRFREAPHVKFDSALIYSAPGFKTGRSFSGVIS